MEDSTEQDALDRAWSTMRLHPEYHESFKEVHECLMKGDGPLNYINRHYIAIMAASRHYCSEMINYHASILQEKTTQTAASDETVKSWLRSGFRLNDASGKIHRLDQTNMILAHKPWMLTKHHISELTQRIEGGFKVDGSQRWSLSQVTQALTLMAHIHSFSSFVLGCGIMENVCNEANKEVTKNEEDEKGPSNVATLPCDINSPQSSDVIPNEIVGEELLKVPTIVAKMETLGSEIEELEMSELARRFEKIETSAVDDVVDLTSKDEKAPIFKRSRSQTPNDIDGEGSRNEPVNELHPDNFSQNLDSYQYVDFVKRESPDIYRTLRDGEFCWGEHAYSIISKFYTDNVATVLDKKFMTIDNLTYMNIGSYTSVDTSLFRRAIQCYVQCLYGIRHDDYNYALVNELLPRRLKKYIKTLTCYPERCNIDEYNAIMPDLRRSEKIHVCILVCEARLQSELLYACRAISDYYNSCT